MYRLSPVALLLFFLFLPKGVAQYLVPFALILLLVQGRKDILRYFNQKIIFLMFLIGPMLVTLFFSPAEVVRFFSLIVLIFIFPFSSIKTDGVAGVALFCFIYALIFQVGIVLGLPFFSEFRSRFYPAELVTWSQVDLGIVDVGFRTVRASGLFYNPNVAALMSLFVYLIFAISWGSPFKGRLHLVVLVMTAVSLMLAGSRTYISAFVLIIFFVFVKGVLARVVVAGLSISALSGVIYSYILEDFISASGSMFIKNEILINYINSKLVDEYGLVSLLFGGEYQTQFDNDIGYIFGGWGGLGLLCVLSFAVYLMVKIRYAWRVLLFIFATMIGNSLFFGLLTAPLLVCLLIVLSKAGVDDGLISRG